MNLIQGLRCILSLLILMIVITACGSGTSSSNTSPRETLVNWPPLFTSETEIFVPDNTIQLPRVTATDLDGDPITYRIVGGVDVDRFQIDSQSGDLRFRRLPDFDAPADSNANNTYIITVEASDGINTTWQTLAVSVTSVGSKLTVYSSDIKTLTFSWAAVSGVTHYKLFVNGDGNSGYTQLGENIVTTHTEVKIAVHLTDWFNSSYLVEGHDDQGVVYRSEPAAITELMLDRIGYFKASNTEGWDRFGISVALSADGNTLAVGASDEDSATTGINGGQDDNTVRGAGAVYVFSRVDGVWIQQAYIKASNTDAGDGFGKSVVLSADGNTLAVGAPQEDSAATGIDGVQDDNSARDSGAVYMFSRVDGVWIQQAYVKASNVLREDYFGTSVALSTGGDTLAVGAPQTVDVGSFWAEYAGSAYVFNREDGGWIQQAYVKASNAVEGDRFGAILALSADGDTLAVGPGLDLAGLSVAGVVYVFNRVDGAWIQQAYVKASNSEAGWNSFGESLALSGDGNILAVGAIGEDSAAIGINGDQSDNSATTAGAVYVFSREDDAWIQQTYVKASNAEAGDEFGTSLALSGDGHTLVVGAPREDGAATGINGDQGYNSSREAGAVYLY